MPHDNGPSRSELASRFDVLAKKHNELIDILAAMNKTITGCNEALDHMIGVLVPSLLLISDIFHGKDYTHSLDKYDVTIKPYRELSDMAKKLVREHTYTGDYAKDMESMVNSVREALNAPRTGRKSN